MTAKSSIIKRTIISVSDKKGLAVFATELHQLGIEIIATGGTAKTLRQLNIPTIDVQSVTHFPEMMGGRVKTLHPNILAGVLARRGIDDQTLADHQITPIDLVVVNLYPFQKTIEDPSCTQIDAIENIDIGGPTLLRSAAKNYEFVTVITDPNDYPMIIDNIKSGNTSLKIRQQLAQKAFAHTAQYDSTIANYLSDDETTTIKLIQKETLRYGENPHQKATLYIQNHEKNSLTEAQQLQGKPLSFNNLMDSDAALSCVRHFDKQTPTCVIVKHATPCGVGQASNLTDAYLKALATDPTSAFGGIIAFNQKLDVQTVQTILDKQFTEVILAPNLALEAESLLSHRKNLRVLITGDLTAHQNTLRFHSISGGLLIQDSDDIPDDPSKFTVVSKRQPTAKEMSDCLFAWNVVRFVKSNAIVYAKNNQTLGIGTGQTSRVFSAEIAALKAKEAELSLKNSVVASDAFYPFADGVEVAAQAGVTAIIQPGGSKRDSEVITTANQLNLAMIFTHRRHFRH